MPSSSVEELLYGIPDFYSPGNEPSSSECIVFAVIGNVQDWKGQDVFLEAVASLLDTVDVNAEFWIVGEDESLFAQGLKKKYMNEKHIRFCGKTRREKMREIAGKISVLVVPSRQDSMPVVAVEAMMNRKPCIVSDCTGIASYIKNGEDGLVFQSEDVRDLKEKMKWCVDHADRLPAMGHRARRIYDKWFSVDVFEKNLLRIVEECI